MKKTIFTLGLLLYFINYFGQQFIYQGNNKQNNFSFLFVNDTDSIKIFSISRGQVLHSEKLDFVVTNGYNYWKGPRQSRTEELYAFSLDNTLALPDSGTIFSLENIIYTDVIWILDSLAKTETIANHAQIKFWNLFNKKQLNESKKYIYSFGNTDNKLIYESPKSDFITVLALIDALVIDTLVKSKPVGMGAYTINFNKNILSNLYGKPQLQIHNQAGEIVYSDFKKINALDTLHFYLKHSYKAPKAYTKTSLKAYNTKGKLVSTLFQDKKMIYGTNVQLYAFEYYGAETDSLILKLCTKKGKLLDTKTTTYKEQIKNGMNASTKEHFTLIKQKYSCKKNELRAQCTIELSGGEVLATIFEGKNIHAGVNKIEYNFKNNLEEGSKIWLVVKLPSGKIISKNMISISAQ